MNTRLFDQWVEMNQAALAPIMRWREITTEATDKTVRYHLGVTQDCLELGNRQMQVMGEAQYPQDWLMEGNKNIADFGLKMMGRVSDYFKMAKDHQETVGAWAETTAKAAVDSFKTNVAAV